VQKHADCVEKICVKKLALGVRIRAPIHYPLFGNGKMDSKFVYFQVLLGLIVILFKF